MVFSTYLRAFLRHNECRSSPTRGGTFEEEGLLSCENEARWQVWPSRGSQSLFEISPRHVWCLEITPVHGERRQASHVAPGEALHLLATGSSLRKVFASEIGMQRGSQPSTQRRNAEVTSPGQEETDSRGCEPPDQFQIEITFPRGNEAPRESTHCGS